MNDDPLRTGLEKLRQYAAREVYGAIEPEEAAAIRVACGEQGCLTDDARVTGTMGFRDALGAIPREPGDMPAEEAIRRQRGGCVEHDRLEAEVGRLTEAITNAERILSPHITTVPPYPEPDPISQAWVVLAAALGKVG